MDEVKESKEAPKEEVKPDLAAEAFKEWQAGKGEDEQEKPESDLPETEKPDEESNPPQEKPKEGEKKPDEKPEEKTDEKPTGEAEQKPTVDEEKIIADWAIKHSLTLAEAKEDLQKTKSVVEKFKTPEEMARTLRHLQSEHDKLKNAAAQKPEEDPYKVSNNPRLEVYEFVNKNQEKLVENYRNQYPAKSRDMEDDVILEEVAERLVSDYSVWNSGQIKKRANDAVSRREQLLSSIPETDRRFIPDVKAVLDKTDDRAVVSKDFNVNDIIHWAKGQQFDKAVKDAEERGYKKGKEEAKILGTIPSGSPKGSTPQGKGSKATLSSYEQRLAREMFSTTSWTDEEKYEAYLDVTKKGKKK